MSGSACSPLERIRRPPDPLTLSIWEWGAQLAAMTEEERAAEAAMLGISIEDLLKIQRDIQKSVYKY